MLYVMKIGGSRLKDIRDYYDAASLALALGARVVVVSAMQGVTDMLLNAVKARNLGQLEELVGSLAEKYRDFRDPRLELYVSGCLAAYRKMLLDGERPSLVDEVLALGERLSMIAMEHALREAGLRVISMDGGDAGILTNSNFTDAEPIFDESLRRLSRLSTLLGKGYTLVVAGFIGRTVDGRTSTMGRGSSDLTATLIARALSAERVYLVTDQPFIMSCDPRTVRDARPLRQVSISEADAMARLGVKKFHRLTFKPLLDSSCEVVVGSLPDGGTLVSRERKPPELKVVATCGGALAVVGYGSRKYLEVFSRELCLPPIEVEEEYFLLRARGDASALLEEAHRLMLEHWPLSSMYISPLQS